jgi:hypothetical protein
LRYPTPPERIANRVVADEYAAVRAKIDALYGQPPALPAESACETCAYFRTGTEFLPILVRQRDHARDHGQADRAALFDGLIQRAGTGPATPERS